MRGAPAEDAHHALAPSSPKLGFVCSNLSQEADCCDEVTFHRHWRSNSAPDEADFHMSWDVCPKSFSEVKEDIRRLRRKIERGSSKHSKAHSNKELKAGLEQDVKHLQTSLDSQTATRDILKQAFTCPSSLLIPLDNNLVSQHTQNLIKDIAILEVEVAQLERYLLSLYRKAFETSATKHSPVVKKSLNTRGASTSLDNQARELPAQPIINKYGITPVIYPNKPSARPKSGSLAVKTPFACSGSHSFHASNNKRGVSSVAAPITGRLELSLSQPIISPRQEAVKSPSSAACELWHEVISANPGALFTTSEAFAEPIYETPNKLSEELVRCMAAIYCKLADPPIPNIGSSSSSSLSSASTHSASSDGWSSSQTNVLKANPGRRKIGFENDLTVVVHWISVDNERLKCAAKMVQNFRTLVQQLEKVDAGRLKHEERLAFWLNIHNALMMHAYLAYGIPRSHLKRPSLLQKAAYKIGAHLVTAHMIEYSILGYRSHGLVQWIHSLLSSPSKIRGPDRQTYALQRPEPLVYFGICSGGLSDPAVRVYTPKNVYHELDYAKRQFLQSNISIQKETKILLPKMLEAFARDSSMDSFALLEWVCQNVNEQQRLQIRRCTGRAKPHRCIEWLPYNFDFRYVFVSELARWFRDV